MGGGDVCSAGGGNPGQYGRLETGEMVECVLAIRTFGHSDIRTKFVRMVFPNACPV